MSIASDRTLILAALLIAASFGAPAAAAPFGGRAPVAGAPAVHPSATFKHSAFADPTPDRKFKKSKARYAVKANKMIPPCYDGDLVPVSPALGGFGDEFAGCSWWQDPPLWIP